MSNDDFKEDLFPKRYKRYISKQKKLLEPYDFVKSKCKVIKYDKYVVNL